MITGPVTIEMVSGPIAAAAAGRVVAAVSAQAGLGIDRLTGAALLAEALTAGVPPRPAGRPMRLVITLGPGRVGMEVGPIEGGDAAEGASGGRLGMGSVLDGLLGTVSTRSAPDGEYLVIDLAD